MTINKVILIGRAGKEPETRYMPNGEAVTTLSIATSESWKDKSGVKQERVEWHNLVFYRRLAEVVGEFVKKGALIYVEGKLQTRKWQDKDGADRYTTEIICHEMTMLGGRSAEDGADSGATPKSAPPRSAPPAKSAPPSAASSAPDAADRFNFDNDVPF